MNEPKNCPQCKEGILVAGDGQLDQSGQTHLPTTVFSCSRCGYQNWLRSNRAWQSNVVKDPFTGENLIQPRKWNGAEEQVP